MTNTLNTITYSSVVKRETLCITLTMAALHDLQVKEANILNAYVMTPNHEKIWTVLSPEFGNNVSKTAVIVRALYGLKSAGASILQNICRNWGIALAMHTLTCG